MVEDGGCYVVGSCRCPRSRPGYLPALADARHHPGAPHHGRPIAPASMHRLIRPRRRPLQLVNRIPDPVPHPAAGHVPFGHQLVRPLGSVYAGFIAVSFDRGLGCSIDFQIREHRS